MAKKEINNRDWSMPLTDEEKDVIAKVWEGENVIELRLWLRDVVKIAEGLAEKLQNQLNLENAVKEIVDAVDNEVLEFWRMGGYRQPEQDYERVINAVKNAKAVLDE